MHIRKLVVASCLVFCAAQAGGAASEVKPAPRKTCEGLGDASFFRDEGINIKVASKLRFNKALMRESIQTRTNGGIVTLSGSVSTAEHAQLAAKLAAEVGGVRCVSNFLEVGPAPAPPRGSPY